MSVSTESTLCVGGQCEMTKHCNTVMGVEIDESVKTTKQRLDTLRWCERQQMIRKKSELSASVSEGKMTSQESDDAMIRFRDELAKEVYALVDIIMDAEEC